ncbi:putative phenazine biosynthesis protein PhzE [Actinacidiphila reveromycinica]|uniref:anthranilate synthase n=1 Tax=Actinacidiphila reveromycinica TaxID=659352 RepID=A0A7U3UWF5_9ACTN|nr:anthranilate synthase family protein [Streptomyces sp. SN-593]BBB00128.1 putative phenazine biosynthesis protein PhzE [Streptomyces sp. SN-593]
MTAPTPQAAPSDPAAATRPAAPAADPRAMLARITAGNDGEPFALLHRPESGRPGAGPLVDLLTGPIGSHAELADLPLNAHTAPGRHELLVLMPFRQIAERGFAHVDDGTPMQAIRIEQQSSLPLDDLLAALPSSQAHPIQVRDARFDLDDEAYAETARRIVTEEIGTGAGANFVLKRTYLSRIDGWSVPAALAYYGRLLRRTSGQYWTFLVHTGERTLVGASPERHITLRRGTAVMNPISGTYRYPPGGPTAAGVLDFLADRKETNELYMVLDEELKMMSRVCEQGGQVLGPRLREMTHLAHTEYFIEGRTSHDVRDILRETLLAPTVTGSPLESACRAIARYEPEGRGYYAGVAALIGRDATGRREMDSAILIRTADIDTQGRLRMSVGATLVRDSDPAAEAVETRAKAAGLLAALHDGAAEGTGTPGGTPAGEDRGTDPAAAGAPSAAPAAAPAGAGHWTSGPAWDGRIGEIRSSLAARNEPLAPFWQAPPQSRGRRWPRLDGRRVLIIDAEDTFTAMGATLLRGLGCTAEVRRFDEPYGLDAADLVIVGPGPGDPRDTRHPKIAHLRAVTRVLADRGTPFLSVCLGHQVLSGLLGLPLIRKEVPNQGVQREVDVLGSRELVYFYNTFAAVSEADAFRARHLRPGPVQVSRDPVSGEVHALRGDGFCSLQFHPASVMTRNGHDLLGRLLSGLLDTEPAAVGAPATASRATVKR